MNREMIAKTNCKGFADASVASPDYSDDLQAEHQRLRVCPWISQAKVQA